MSEPTLEDRIGCGVIIAIAILCYTAYQIALLFAR